MGTGVTVEWSEGSEPPRALTVDAIADLLPLLHEIHEAAVQRGLSTAALITRGESSLSVVLGTGAIAFLQWMGGDAGSYLGVDVGEQAGSGAVIALSYLGHYSEIPTGDFVPRDEALEEVGHFAATGGLSQRWQWTGWLEGDADPGRDARVIAPQ